MTGRTVDAGNARTFEVRPDIARDGGITLIPASDFDTPFLDRVYASTRQEEMDRLDWDQSAKDAFLSMQSSAQRIHYLRAYPTDRYRVVMLDGTPAGRLLTSELTDEIRIVDIALLTEFRGRGVGTALITEVLRQAREAGKACRIHVEVFNPAMRLYERLGFRKVGDQGVYWLLEWSVKTVADSSADRIGQTPRVATRCLASSEEN